MRLPSERRRLPSARRSRGGGGRRRMARRGLGAPRRSAAGGSRRRPRGVRAGSRRRAGACRRSWPGACARCLWATCERALRFPRFVRAAMSRTAAGSVPGVDAATMAAPDKENRDAEVPDPQALPRHPRHRERRPDGPVDPRRGRRPHAVHGRLRQAAGGRTASSSTRRRCRPRAPGSARTTRASPPITDGPFAETKDLIAGWYVIDVDGWDRAVELAGELSLAPAPAASRSTSGSRCAPSTARRPATRTDPTPDGRRSTRRRCGRSSPR